MIGAAGEAGLAQAQQALRGRTVTLPCGQSSAYLCWTTCSDTPPKWPSGTHNPTSRVLLNERVVGLLTRHDLTRWLSENAADRNAGEATRRKFETVDRSEPLDAVFDRCRNSLTRRCS